MDDDDDDDSEANISDACYHFSFSGPIPAGGIVWQSIQLSAYIMIKILP